MACLLCGRGFKDLDTMTKHQNYSSLHSENVIKLRAKHILDKGANPSNSQIHAQQVAGRNFEKNSSKITNSFTLPTNNTGSHFLKRAYPLNSAEVHTPDQRGSVNDDRKFDRNLGAENESCEHMNDDHFPRCGTRRNEFRSNSSSVQPGPHDSVQFDSVRSSMAGG